MPTSATAKAEMPSPGAYATAAAVAAADQRRRLIEALTLVVAEYGFEATTVDQILKVAQLRRSVFDEHFDDKRDCFAAAYEIAQERLLGVLTFHCYTRTGPANRIGSALSAGLDLLAASPALTRLILIEAPAVGAEIAARHHWWLDRYGRLLRFAAMGSADVAAPKPPLEPAVVGGIVSRVKQLALAGETEQLPNLCPELVQFALSFYGSLEPSTTSGGVASEEPPQPQSPDRSSLLEPVV